MSIAISCHGCGQRFDVPDDYQRRKIRCAACGVYCEVPEPSKKSSAAKMPAKEKVKHSSPAGDTDAIFADAYREEAVAKRAPEAKITDPLPVSPPCCGAAGLAAATELAPWPSRPPPVVVNCPGALVVELAPEHAARSRTAGRTHRSRFITYLPSSGHARLVDRRG